MKVALNLLNAHALYGGDFGGIIEVARLADRAGIDQLTTGEHLLLRPAGLELYPRGPFAYPLDYPFFEPITMLAAIAAVTKQIRLSSNILIAPLRPAILLAKQLATLDVISRGRVDIGVGVGWQKAEFDSAGLRFETRYGDLEDQVLGCRALWRGAPASFRGKRLHFENVYALPLPVQPGGVPFWFGMDATPRNVERIARLADGWAAPPTNLETVAAGIAAIRAALTAQGRDAATFPVRATLRAVRLPDGTTDIEKSFAGLPAYAAAGVTMITGNIRDYCRSADEVQPLIDRLVALKHA